MIKFHTWIKERSILIFVRTNCCITWQLMINISFNVLFCFNFSDFNVLFFQKKYLLQFTFEQKIDLLCKKREKYILSEEKIPAPPPGYQMVRPLQGCGPVQSPLPVSFVYIKYFWQFGMHVPPRRWPCWEVWEVLYLWFCKRQVWVFEIWWLSGRAA